MTRRLFKSTIKQLPISVTPLCYQSLKKSFVFIANTHKLNYDCFEHVGMIIASLSLSLSLSLIERETYPFYKILFFQASFPLTRCV
jgi:hypothetical protein